MTADEIPRHLAGSPGKQGLRTRQQRRVPLPQALAWAVILTVWPLGACELTDPPPPAPQDAPRAEAPPVRGRATPPRASSRRQGRWRPARSDSETREALIALGYAEGIEPVPARVGVLHHEPDLASPAPRLFTSGHAPGAWLIRPNGDVIHQWRRAWGDLFPDDELLKGNPSAVTWRRAHLLPNGDILAVFEGLGIVRLTSDSQVVWARDNRAHHDLAVRGDDLWILTRAHERLAAVDPAEDVLVDRVARLSLTTGETKQSWSIPSAVLRHGYPLRRPEKQTHRDDLLHTNSLVLLQGQELPPWIEQREPHVLLSLLAIDQLALLNLTDGQLSWLSKGPFSRQHDPHILGPRDWLIFDNHAGSDRSRVVRFNPVTGAAIWTWDDQGQLFSDTCGAAIPLRNGNILVTESDAGRAVEVTESGRVVWRFRSPHRAGRRDQLIATLFEMQPVDDDLAWLQD